jgi:hypothetical protein
MLAEGTPSQTTVLEEGTCWEEDVGRERNTHIQVKVSVYVQRHNKMNFIIHCYNKNCISSSLQARVLQRGSGENSINTGNTSLPSRFHGAVAVSDVALAETSSILYESCGRRRIQSFH